MLRAAQTAGQSDQAERNELSKKIGQAKAQKNEAEAQALLARVEALKGASAEHAEAERLAGEALRGLLMALGLAMNNTCQAPQPLRGHLFFHNLYNVYRPSKWC